MVLLKNYLYHIEKSEAYETKKNNMKIVEFIFNDYEKQRLLVVEAKTRAPNPNGIETPERFKEYIGEIEEKFCNSLDLYLNQSLCKALPAGFENIDYDNLKIIFVLVIKNQKEQWLPAVKEELEKAVNSHLRLLKIWKCNVVVLNEERARRIGLIA